MQKWEYKVLHRVRPVSGSNVANWDEPIVSELPAIGDDGWELVTVITRSSVPGQVSSGVTTDEMWVFKRPKQAASNGRTEVVAQSILEPTPLVEDVEIVTSTEAANES